MTSAGACADDVLRDAGNMHGGILFHDARRSVDGGIRHCEHNVRHSLLSTHEAERELRQDNEVTFRQTRTVDQLADDPDPRYDSFTTLYSPPGDLLLTALRKMHATTMAMVDALSDGIIDDIDNHHGLSLPAAFCDGRQPRGGLPRR